MLFQKDSDRLVRLRATVQAKRSFAKFACETVFAPGQETVPLFSPPFARASLADANERARVFR